MIDRFLRQKIEPQLKMLLTRDEYEYIDQFFSEVYLDEDENGNQLVALHPLKDEYMTMEFSYLTGSYVRQAFWGEVKQKGILL